MEPLRPRICFGTAITTVALHLCSPAVAGSQEDAINRRMRAQIRADIKAHGQIFSGPEIVPSSLLKAIEGKRLVGLGEGTHGTSEIQTLLGNIILAMAKSGHVLVFLEEPYGGVAQINQWVQGAGKDSDLLTLMTTPGLLYGVHKTQEYASLFRAARAFNATAPAGGKLEFYGVDSVMAPGPWDVTPALRSFCTTNNLGLSDEIRLCSNFINVANAYTPDVRAAALGAAAKILGTVSRVPATTPGQLEANVMANALAHYVQTDVVYNNVFGSIHLNFANDTPTNNIANGVRDSAMAENIKILMDGKIPTSGRAVYWGHNAHVGRISMLNADPTGMLSTWASTGCTLNLWLGDAYFPLAALVGKGTFRVHLVDNFGNVGPFQPVNSPSIIQADCLNAISASVFPSNPVFFATKDVSLLGFTRPEFYVAGAWVPNLPETWYTNTVPGVAYGGVISFPISTAAHEMSELRSKPTHP